MPTKDYYKILGVRPTASKEEIELAYKGRRSQYHPDKYCNVDAETMKWATANMQDVNEAYTALSDVEFRKEYDETYNRGADENAANTGFENSTPRQPASAPKEKAPMPPTGSDNRSDAFHPAQRPLKKSKKPSWAKAFILTPIVTWIVSFAGYDVFGFTPTAYLFSGALAGFVSATLYCYLLPRSKFFIAVVTYAALYAADIYFPATAAAGDLQNVSHLHGIVFTAFAGLGVVISFLLKKRTTRELSE